MNKLIQNDYEDLKDTIRVEEIVKFDDKMNFLCLKIKQRLTELDKEGRKYDNWYELSKELIKLNREFYLKLKPAGDHDPYKLFDIMANCILGMMQLGEWSKEDEK